MDAETLLKALIRLRLLLPAQVDACRSHFGHNRLSTAHILEWFEGRGWLTSYQLSHLRKGEIDVRNGTLIRELTNAEADSVQAQQTALKNAANTNSQVLPVNTDEAKIYVSEVPPEFRRIELFIGGTFPNKVLLPAGEENFDTNLQGTVQATPQATTTPFTTWQDAQQQNQRNSQPYPPARSDSAPDFERTITIMFCPITGMRATANCPTKQPKSFREGEEPKDFCTFHINPPK